MTAMKRIKLNESVRLKVTVCEASEDFEAEKKVSLAA